MGTIWLSAAGVYATSTSIRTGLDGGSGGGGGTGGGDGGSGHSGSVSGSQGGAGTSKIVESQKLSGIGVPAIRSYTSVFHSRRTRV